MCPAETPEGKEGDPCHFEDSYSVDARGIIGCPGGTPTDLASTTRHKGIVGYLAKCSLTSHRVALTLKGLESGDLAEDSSVIGIGDVAAQTVVQPFDRDPLLKDFLSVVRNATHVVAWIYQFFRVQSFHRKKLMEYGYDEYGISRLASLSTHLNEGS